MDVVGYAMGTHCTMFKVHHGGTFNKQCRINYVRGNVSSYPNPYDGNKLKFSDIEEVCSTYGSRSGDLLYYSLLGLPLDQGLRLMLSDYSVNEMVAKHLGYDLVILYIVTYGVTDNVVDGDEEEDSEYKRAVMFRNDAFWDSMLSDNTDCLDSDKDTSHPSRDIDEGVENAEGVVQDADVEGDVGGDGDSSEGDASEGDVGEGGDESDGSVEEYDSDQLESPHSSNDDRIVYSTHMDVTKRVYE